MARKPGRSKKTSQKKKKQLSPSTSGKSLKKPLKNKSKIQNENKIKVANQKIPRHKERYPALNFKRQVKLRMEALDGIQEYVHLLSDKEKEWLNRFLEETVITNFQHKGKLIYKGKKKRREFYGDNNLRNRCIYNKSKAMGTLLFVDNFNGVMDNNLNNNTNNTEDAMVELLTAKRSGVFESDED